jgi:hypothetical protein
MIPELRKYFNTHFTDELYRKQIADLEQKADCEIEFRIAETPVFLPADLAARAGRLAEELIVKAASPELQQIGEKAIPAKYNVPREHPRPRVAAVDFAFAGSRENIEFKLIELQGFASLFHYQPVFSLSVRDIYGLPQELNGMIAPTVGMEHYYDLLNKIFVGGADPGETVIVDYAPFSQKTLPDFLLAKKQLGIELADVRNIFANGDQLYMKDNKGRRRPVKRIYCRAIPDELERKGAKLNFDFSQEYDVEWAYHPNWYFRISKVLLPHLMGTNETVPNAVIVSDADHKALDLSNYVLKPLYSFAGTGVNIEPTSADIEAIPAEERSGWLLQEKINYADIITTPSGDNVRGELRVLLIWQDGDDRPTALHTLVRLTRGKMIGVDYNKGLDWVGSSCALVQP